MSKEDKNNRDDQFLHDLHSIVSDNLGDESFGVEDLVRASGISRSQLHRKLKKLKNKSISRFIREIRLEKGYRMLQNNEDTVSEIAYKVGFHSPTYFNTCFREYFGYTPGEAKFRSLAETSLQTPKQNLTGDGETPRWKQSRLLWPLSIAVLVLLVSFTLYELEKREGISESESQLPESDKISIAVLPFHDLVKDSTDLLSSSGIMNNVVNNLSKVPEFTVLPIRTSNLYRNSELLPTELGAELGVQYIIDGTFQKIDSLSYLTLALTSTSDGSQIWTSDIFTVPDSIPELFAMQAELVNQVASQLRTNLSPELNKSFASTPTADGLAYEYYLRGQAKLREINYYIKTNKANNTSLDEAKLYFNLAIERDSNFAAAYLGLARTEFMMNENIRPNITPESSLLRIDKWVTKALQLDPELSDAHYLKGKHSLHALNSILGAEQHWRKALELDPNNIDALYDLAELYLWRKLDILEGVRLFKEIEKQSIDDEELYKVYLGLSQAYSKIGDLGMEWFYLQALDKILEKDKITDNNAILAMPWYLFRSGQQEKALRELNLRYPQKNNQFKLIIHANYLAWSGRWEEAVPLYEEWAKLVEVQSADNWFSINDWHRYGQALVKTGKDSLGETLIRRQISINRQIEKNGPGNASIYDMAGMYSFLNKLDSANFYFKMYLKRDGLLRGWGHPTWIMIDPQYDNIRSDPKFKEQLRAQNKRLKDISERISEVDPNAVQLE